MLLLWAKCLALVEGLLPRTLGPAGSEQIKIVTGIGLQQLPCLCTELIQLGALAVPKTPNADALDFIAQDFLFLVRLHEENLERVDVRQALLLTASHTENLYILKHIKIMLIHALLDKIIKLLAVQDLLIGGIELYAMIN
jgi:hypothetical protein